MRIGRLDRRIIIQCKTSVPNTFGELVDTWVPLVTIWAERLEIRGAERWASMQTVHQADIKYRIRYRSAITTQDRIVNDDSKTFDIVAVLELGRREGLELHCKAVNE